MVANHGTGDDFRRGLVLAADAAFDDLNTMATARMNIQRLQRGLVDADTGQRGCLLTDRKDFLKT